MWTQWTSSNTARRTALLTEDPFPKGCPGQRVPSRAIASGRSFRGRSAVPVAEFARCISCARVGESSTCAASLSKPGLSQWGRGCIRSARGGVIEVHAGTLNLPESAGHIAEVPRRPVKVRRLRNRWRACWNSSTSTSRDPGDTTIQGRFRSRLQHQGSGWCSPHQSFADTSCQPCGALGGNRLHSA